MHPSLKTAALFLTVAALATTAEANLALLPGTTAFSNGGDYDTSHTPAKLIDGTRDGRHFENTTYHSAINSTAAAPINFGVTLSEPAALGDIILFNRTDCCGYRIDGSGTAPFTLAVFSGANTVPVFSQEYTFTADVTGPNVSGMTFDVGGVVGDKIQFTQRSANESVNIAEIEVYAVPEPTSAAVLGVTLGALLLSRRRRTA